MQDDLIDVALQVLVYGVPLVVSVIGAHKGWLALLMARAAGAAVTTVAVSFSDRMKAKNKGQTGDHKLTESQRLEAMAMAQETLKREAARLDEGAIPFLQPKIGPIAQDPEKARKALERAVERRNARRRRAGKVAGMR
jgi:hypothetical protein